MTTADIPFVDRMLAKEFVAHDAPIIELVQAHTRDPFCVLVGTILSARTKDQCTAGAVKRLFAEAEGDVFAPSDLERLPEKRIEKLIFPVGFFRDKARHLKALPAAIEAEFAPGKGLAAAARAFAAAGDDLATVPQYNALVECLTHLPGVGRKTANLTVAVGFDLPAVCVDVHVHRICNRLGLVSTRTPLETEMALRSIVPVKYWKTWNSHLVSFGQTRCGPVRPRCAGCPIASRCAARSCAEHAGVL